jgi:proliferating cell nuclear antigen
MSEFNLSLMNLDSENLGIPETEFSSVCRMPSQEFNRICREFGGLSETIKIETNKECIKYSIVGSLGAGNAVLNARETGDES